MENVKKRIDRAISDYMESKDMSQTEMASLLRMTPNTLRAKRRGDSDWTWSELNTMCDLFGMTPNQLTGIS